MAKKHYEDRTDLGKLQSQWNKISGLLVRKGFSSAIIRCGTAAEIAANVTIRSVFDEKSESDAKTVDSFLIWANGLKGKMDHLVPLVCFNSDNKNETYKKLLVGENHERRTEPRSASRIVQLNQKSQNNHRGGQILHHNACAAV